MDDKFIYYPASTLKEDTITIYGAGIFREEKLVLDKTKASMLFIELWNFLNIGEIPQIEETSEKLYTKGEVEELIYAAMKSRNYTPLCEFNEWIKENLK